MSYTWEHEGKIFQTDPMGLVPSPTNSNELVPLYNLINLSEERARTISYEWRLKQLRLYRDKLIAETDWWVLPDINPSPAQLKYRQDLRDLTNNFDPDATPNFPVKP